MTLPQAKLPSWNVPTVRPLPSIPNVGCVSGNATTVIGEQFGNFPDVQALPHIKALNKVITEQIGTLLEGKLPDAPRSIAYEARRSRLVNELAQIVNSATAVGSQIQSEINGAISACNEKISDLNASKNAILQTPANLRSAVQVKALNRYNTYIAEVNSQIGRLQTSLGCLN